MEFHLDGTRQGMFVHDGIRQAGKPLICYFSLTNRDPCGRK